MNKKDLVCDLYCLIWKEVRQQIMKLNKMAEIRKGNKKKEINSYRHHTTNITKKEISSREWKNNLKALRVIEKLCYIPQEIKMQMY